MLLVLLLVMALELNSLFLEANILRVRYRMSEAVIQVQIYVFKIIEALLFSNSTHIMCGNFFKFLIRSFDSVFQEFDRPSSCYINVSLHRRRYHHRSQA